MEKFDEYTYDDYEEDIEEYEEIEQEDNKKADVISTLSTVSNWFIKFGIVVAVILLVYYLFTGNIIDALLYIIGLVISFFFGYFFMYLLDKCIGEE